MYFILHYEFSKLKLFSNLSTMAAMLIQFGMVLYLTCGNSAELMCNILSIAYPVYMTCKSFRSNDNYKRSLWLTFWCIYSGISLIDRMTFWNQTFTLYWIAKTVTMDYVKRDMRGTRTFYNLFLKPTPPLPMECWSLIGAYLPVKCKISLSMVSRATNEAVRSPIAWSNIKRVTYYDREVQNSRSSKLVFFGSDHNICYLRLLLKGSLVANNFAMHVHNMHNHSMNLFVDDETMITAASYLSPRIRAVHSLSVMIQESAERDMYADCLRVFIESNGLPKLNEITTSSRDCRAEQNIKMLLDSQRPIKHLRFLAFHSTGPQWRLNSITHLELRANVHDNHITIGDSQLEHIKIDSRCHVIPEFVLKQRNVKSLHIVMNAERMLLGLLAMPNNVPIFNSSLLILKLEVATHEYSSWEYAHRLLDRFPATTSINFSLNFNQANVDSLKNENCAARVVTLLKKLVLDNRTATNRTLILTLFDERSEEGATEDFNLTYGWDPYHRHKPLSDEDVTLAFQIGKQIAPFNRWSRESDVHTSSTVVIHRAWANKISYMSYSIKNGKYSFGRGKYPKFTLFIGN